MESAAQSTSPINDRPQPAAATPLTTAAPAVVVPATAEAPARRKRRPFVILGVIAVLALAIIGVYTMMTAGRENTDDAQIAADVVPIGTRVAGAIARVHVKENQLVKRGDLLIEIDPSDYDARVQQAEAELATANAQAAGAQAQVEIVDATSKGGWPRRRPRSPARTPASRAPARRSPPRTPRRPALTPTSRRPRSISVARVRSARPTPFRRSGSTAPRSPSTPPAPPRRRPTRRSRWPKTPAAAPRAGWARRAAR